VARNVDATGNRLIRAHAKNATVMDKQSHRQRRKLTGRGFLTTAHYIQRVNNMREDEIIVTITGCVQVAEDAYKTVRTSQAFPITSSIQQMLEWARTMLPAADIHDLAFSSMSKPEPAKISTQPLHTESK